MKLRDLDAELLWKVTPDGRSYRTDAPSLAEAQGVLFQCPKCAVGKESGEEDGRRFFRGAHYVLCWFNGRGVPDEIDPKPGRWNPSGTGLDDLTFVPPGAVSVLLTGAGCGWHGFVKDGDAA